MKSRIMYVWPILLVLTLIAACGGSEPEVLPAEAEMAYLDQLATHTHKRMEFLSRMDKTLGPLFPRFAPENIQEAVVFNELREARISEEGQSYLEKVEALEPPERFRADHDRFLESLRKRVAIERGQDAAVENKDMLEFVLAGSRDREIVYETSAVLSGEFCRVTAPVKRLLALCASEDPIPGGEYGAKLRAISVNWVSVFEPRAQIFPAWLPDDALFSGLEIVQPEIESSFIETIEALQSLQPPSKYRAGHEVVLRFFEGLLEVAYAIDRAVEARDVEQVREEFARSGTVAEKANRDLPDNIRPIVSVIFGPEPRR